MSSAQLPHTVVVEEYPLDDPSRIFYVGDPLHAGKPMHLVFNTRRVDSVLDNSGASSKTAEMCHRILAMADVKWILVFEFHISVALHLGKWWTPQLDAPIIDALSLCCDWVDRTVQAIRLPARSFQDDLLVG